MVKKVYYTAENWRPIKSFNVKTIGYMENKEELIDFINAKRDPSEKKIKFLNLPVGFPIPEGFTPIYKSFVDDTFMFVGEKITAQKSVLELGLKARRNIYLVEAEITYENPLEINASDVMATKNYSTYSRMKDIIRKASKDGFDMLIVKEESGGVKYYPFDSKQIKTTASETYLPHETAMLALIEQILQEYDFSKTEVCQICPKEEIINYKNKYNEYSTTKATVYCAGRLFFDYASNKKTYISPTYMTDDAIAAKISALKQFYASKFTYGDRKYDYNFLGAESAVCEITFKHPLVIDLNGKPNVAIENVTESNDSIISDAPFFKNLICSVQEDGYDGIIIKNRYNTDTDRLETGYITLGPKSIKIIEQDDVCTHQCTERINEILQNGCSQKVKQELAKIKKEVDAYRSYSDYHNNLINEMRTKLDEFEQEEEYDERI